MKPRLSSVYDPTFDPRQQDVAVSWDGNGEEVAVAILTQSGAFAFSTASYEHFRFSNSDWQLKQGTYRISVRVRGSNVDLKQDFKLEYLDNVFSNFQLKPI
jgi:allophanate hydrolase subunit 2